MSALLVTAAIGGGSVLILLAFILVLKGSKSRSPGRTDGGSGDGGWSFGGDGDCGGADGGCD